MDIIQGKQGNHATVAYILANTWRNKALLKLVLNDRLKQHPSVL